MALHVQGTVEVVTGVRVPVSIAERSHDEKLPLSRSPNPHRQPEVGTLPDRHRVPMLTGYRLEFHQPDFGVGRTALPRLLEEAPPHRQLPWRRRRRVDGLIP